MYTSEPMETCPKHDIPYEEIGYDERIVCLECHRENLEKYYRQHRFVKNGKKS